MTTATQRDQSNRRQSTTKSKGAATQKSSSAAAKGSSRGTKKAAATGKSKTRGSSSRRPAWLKHEELAEATARYLLDRDDIASLDEQQLRSRTKRWLKEELGFINNPEFAEAGAARRIFSTPLGLAEAAAEGIATRRAKLADLPAHLGRLCEAELLTPDQERMLFQRMNFLRHQANLHRSRLNPDRPSKARLELVERLIALADWHRDALVQANMRLVFSIVKKFVNQNNAFDDLLSDGIVALIRAVEKFDYDRGFRFSTYATQVVRRNAYRTVVQKQKERSKMVGGLQELGLDVSDEERQPAISEHRWHELRSRLAVMLDDLDRREKFIIRARFSLGSHRKVQTLQALADRLGVSKERVRQLEKRALDKLRGMAGDVKLAELES
jgi:RNA polymerase primary sigma factor